MRFRGMKSAFPFSAAALAVLVSCSTPWAPTTGPAYPADVYVAGQYVDSGLTSHACYWIGASQTVLDASSSATAANAIFVDAGIVYVAGSAAAAGGADHACYWAGGARVDLEPGQASCATRIDKAGTTVRVLGWADTGSGSRVLRLWTTDDGGTTIQAADSALTETEQSFFMSGSDLYVAGTEIGTADHAAYYRKNGGSRVVCPGKGPRVSGVWSDGTDVYLYGDIDYDASCWKNGASIGLSEGSAVSAVATSGADLYLAGYSIDVTGPHSSVTNVIYWKNGKAWRLPGEDAISKAIQVIGGADVYNAGWSMYQHSQTACYWVNGTKIDLAGPPGYGTSTASAMLVVQR